jgi:alkylation response protein AidB-like acyl-CoA dehydrogenase
MTGMTEMTEMTGAPSMRRRAPHAHAEAEARFGTFVRTQLDAHSRERDRDNTPLSREQLQAAAALGLANLAAPAALGGGGASLREWALLLEWLGYAGEDLAVPTLLGYRHAAAALLDELPGAGVAHAAPIYRGERTVSVAYTEGADPFSFRTRALAVAGGYRLSGEKTWIAGGMIADAVIAFAAGPDGDLMAFLVERGDAGVSFAARDLMGMRSLGVASMQLRDVFVPADRLLIARDALTAAQRFFNERRLTMPCGALGRMRRLFEQCVEDLSQRMRYRLPVTEMQAVQSRLGQCYVAIETARTVLYDAIERAAEGHGEGDGGGSGVDRVWDVAITTSKYYVVQQAEAVTRGLAHVLGGAAYDRGQPYERGLRDLHAFLHLAGTQATLEVDLGVKAIAEVEQALARRRRRR